MNSSADQAPTDSEINNTEKASGSHSEPGGNIAVLDVIICPLSRMSSQHFAADPKGKVTIEADGDFLRHVQADLGDHPAHALKLL